MNKKARFFIIIVILLISVVLFLVTYHLLSNRHENDPLIDDELEEIINNVEEINYKEALSDLGYSDFDIKYINYKFSKTDIEKYLLGKQNDKISEYMKDTYFNIKNVSRYVEYDKNNDYSSSEIVMYVEIGLDREFYTNIKEVTNYDEVTVLVNKYNKLPDNYKVSDLIILNNIYSYGSQKVKETIYEPLTNMINKAKEDSIKLFVVSGYRTEKTQNTLFNNSVNRNGMEHALMYSAKKGHSEHQTGYAVDLNTTEDSFVNTKQYEWLKEHTYEYGFIERYPKGKEYITGYGFEPWHYRYVGVGISRIIHNEDITYEEYVVKYLN